MNYPDQPGNMSQFSPEYWSSQGGILKNSIKDVQSGLRMSTAELIAAQPASFAEHFDRSVVPRDQQEALQVALEATGVLVGQVLIDAQQYVKDLEEGILLGRLFFEPPGFNPNNPPNVFVLPEAGVRLEPTTHRLFGRPEAEGRVTRLAYLSDRPDERGLVIRHSLRKDLHKGDERMIHDLLVSLVDSNSSYNSHCISIAEVHYPDGSDRVQVTVGEEVLSHYPWRLRQWEPEKTACHLQTMSSSLQHARQQLQTV